jgi:phosphohistidine phosphatase SixA
MKEVYFVALFLFSQAAWAHPSLLELEEPYTVIIRTPSATIGTDNPRPLITGQACSSQRQLDEQGDKQVQSLKKEFEPLLMFDEVYASEYCRSYQPATTVFPNQQIKIRSFLNDACFNNAPQNKLNTNDFRALIEESTLNRVIFAHNCNIRMLFSKEIKEYCNGDGRLEAGQWIAIKKAGNSLSVVACSD